MVFRHSLAVDRSDGLVRTRKCFFAFWLDYGESIAFSLGPLHFCERGLAAVYTGLGTVTHRTEVNISASLGFSYSSKRLASRVLSTLHCKARNHN